MTRKLVLIVFIITSVQTFAQKEVYFNSSKPEDLKVESLKGVDLQINFNPFSIFESNRYSNTIPCYVGFFSEKRIANTMTLGLSIGLYGSNYKLPIYDYISVYDSISGQNFLMSTGVSRYENVYSLGLRVGIEPRWYWDFKKRAEQNKAKLNSGWFLSIPLNYEGLMYRSYKPTYPSNYSYQSYGYLTLKPTIGYRQSITKNIFLEGSFGYGISLALGSYNGHFVTYLSGTEPELKIKAAYTFK